MIAHCHQQVPSKGWSTFNNQLQHCTCIYQKIVLKSGRKTVFHFLVQCVSHRDDVGGQSINSCLHHRTLPVHLLLHLHAKAEDVVLSGVVCRWEHGRWSYEHAAVGHGSGKGESWQSHPCAVEGWKPSCWRRCRGPGCPVSGSERQAGSGSEVGEGYAHPAGWLRWRRGNWLELQLLLLHQQLVCRISHCGSNQWIGRVHGSCDAAVGCRRLCLFPEHIPFPDIRERCPPSLVCVP